MQNVVKDADKKSKITKEKVNQRQNRSKTFKIGNIFKRLGQGLYVFKTRKGEVLAAAATFYALLSFCPIILLVISIYSIMIGNQSIAYETVMEAVRGNMPNMAPWILDSIQSIVKTQLARSFSIFNLIFLLYTCIRFSGSLVYGVYGLSQSENQTGKVVDELKTIIGGLSIGGFLIFMLFLTSNSVILWNFIRHITGDGIIKKLIQYQVLQAALSIGFFCIYYRWIIPSKVRLSDGILGAVSFIFLFLIGKSFYHVYLDKLEPQLVRSFGNFHTIIASVIWIYFLICAFFYGASVAYAPISMRKIKLEKDLDDNLREATQKVEKVEKNSEKFQEVLD